MVRCDIPKRFSFFDTEKTTVPPKVLRKIRLFVLTLTGLKIIIRKTNNRRIWDKKDETRSMDMNIQKYLAFIKTVEYGSFTKAAEVMNYTQSGISRMISDLEREWNLCLLERNRSGVKLTSDGMKVLPFAQSVCREFDRLASRIDELNGLESGIIRIGTFSSVATHWLPNVISRFQKDFPNIDYELLIGDYAEIAEWIREGRVDCGFLCQPVPSEFEFLPLAKDRLLAVIPDDHPLRDCESFPLEALCESPFLLLEKGENTSVSQFLEEHHLSPDVHFTTWDDYAIMSMVEKGLGIAILPELILKRIPYRILKKELAPPAYREIGLALRDRKQPSLAVKKFLEYLEFRDIDG